MQKVIFLDQFYYCSHNWLSTLVVKIIVEQSLFLYIYKNKATIILPPKYTILQLKNNK